MTGGKHTIPKDGAGEASGEGSRYINLRPLILGVELLLSHSAL